MPPHPPTCPECGAALDLFDDCAAAFHLMLFWENAHADLGAVHHLMVLCYHIQHPTTLSPAGLQAMCDLLTDFVEGGVSPEEVRRQRGESLNSGVRNWKISASAQDRAAPLQPAAWTMTTRDVITAGERRYIESVRLWAASIQRLGCKGE